VQLLALGALQHYLDLTVAHPDLASRDDDHRSMPLGVVPVLARS
jgi:hypothetical protein